MPRRGNAEYESTSSARSTYDLSHEFRITRPFPNLTSLLRVVSSWRRAWSFSRQLSPSRDRIVGSTCSLTSLTRESFFVRRKSINRPSIAGNDRASRRDEDRSMNHRKWLGFTAHVLASIPAWTTRDRLKEDSEERHELVALLKRPCRTSRTIDRDLHYELA